MGRREGRGREERGRKERGKEREERRGRWREKGRKKEREGGSERLKKLYLLVYCFNNRNVSNREKSLKVA